MKKDEEKLYQTYYEPDRLWAGRKAIKVLSSVAWKTTSGSGRTM